MSKKLKLNIVIYITLKFVLYLVLHYKNVRLQLNIQNFPSLEHLKIVE